MSDVNRVIEANPTKATALTAEIRVIHLSSGKVTLTVTEHGQKGGYRKLGVCLTQAARDQLIAALG